jgi:DNA-binding NarL/FixJ family response regulator
MRDTTMTVTVALIDDHIVFREAFRTLIASTQDFAVVAEGKEGQDVCPLYEANRPDVVVMDVTLPGMDGLTATRELRNRHHDAKILMLSAHAVQDYVTRAFSYGATGYALKSQHATAVMEAMKTVARGERYLAPELPIALLNVTHYRGRGMPGQLDGLSNREREVFDLVVRGYSNASISGALSISVKTVETHRANINRKLSVHSSTQLLRYAALRGLVSE